MKKSVKAVNSPNGASPKLVLPLWACRQIRDLARRTGISQERIRDLALGFGLYHAKIELSQVAELMQSAMTLATLDPDENLQQPPSDQEDQQERQTQPDLPQVVSDRQSGDTDLTSNDPRPDHALERSGESGESGTGNDFVTALSGE
jgi:hypothetical protein